MYVPDIIVILATVVLSFVTFLGFMLNMIGPDRNKKLAAKFLFYAGLPLAGLIYWLSLYCQQPWTYTAVQTYPVETVKYNDGSQVQIISIDPVNKVNVTEKLQRTFPPGTTITRKTRQTVYVGLYDVDTSSEKYMYDYFINLHDAPPATQPAGK